MAIMDEHTWDYDTLNITYLNEHSIYMAKSHANQRIVLQHNSVVRISHINFRTHSKHKKP